MEKQKKYQDYLDSEEWKELRAKAYRRASNRCELCANDAQAVHHIQYPKDFKDDDIANLLVVCNICHDKLHGKNLDVPAFNEHKQQGYRDIKRDLREAWVRFEEYITRRQDEITELEGLADRTNKMLSETATRDMLDDVKNTRIYIRAEQDIYWLSRFQKIIENTTALQKD